MIWKYTTRIKINIRKIRLQGRVKTSSTGMLITVLFLPVLSELIHHMILTDWDGVLRPAE